MVHTAVALALLGGKIKWTWGNGGSPSLSNGHRWRDLTVGVLLLSLHVTKTCEEPLVVSRVFRSSVTVRTKSIFPSGSGT